MSSAPDVGAYRQLFLSPPHRAITGKRRGFEVSISVAKSYSDCGL